MSNNQLKDTWRDIRIKRRLCRRARRECKTLDKYMRGEVIPVMVKSPLQRSCEKLVIEHYHEVEARPDPILELIENYTQDELLELSQYDDRIPVGIVLPEIKMEGLI